MPLVLTGSTVTLRPLRADDLPAIYELVSELSSWERRTPRAPAPTTYEAFTARYTLEDSDTRCEFVIEADGTVVGRCALMNIDAFNGHAEIGIGLLAAARGRGYGTDALRVLVEFAFVQRNLRRVHLGAIETNAAALASYRKVGFVEEGRQREHGWARGRYVDEVLMGLLRSDWTA